LGRSCYDVGSAFERGFGPWLCGSVGKWPSPQSGTKGDPGQGTCGTVGYQRVEQASARGDEDDSRGGVLSVEMELERLFDYHRGSAIWMPAGRVIVVAGDQLRQLASAIARGLQGAGPDEKNQALYELARLLGIDASPASEPSVAYAMA
jgi:hypothetical protein